MSEGTGDRFMTGNVECSRDRTWWNAVHPDYLLNCVERDLLADLQQFCLFSI